MPDVLTRLQMLERAVVGLAAGAGRRRRRDEALSSTYLTFNPATGAIGAVFSGLIKALGIVIPQAAGAVQNPTNSIVWENAGGNVLEWIQGYNGGAGFADLLLTANPDTPDIVQIVLASQAIGALGTGGIFLLLKDNGGGNVGLTLLTSAGGSDFVQSNSKTGTATAGAAILPANPVGFLEFTDKSGNNFKVPYYNV